MVILPCPRRSDGFIDEKAIFQFIVGTLGMPLHYLDELFPKEYWWLLENHFEKQKEHYELIAYAVQVGYVRANSKKKIKMFEEEDKPKVNTISQERRKNEINDLKEMFQKN